MYKILQSLIAILFLFSFGCGQKSNSTHTKNANGAVVDEMKESQTNPMESISAETMKRLWEKAEYLDLIFYNSPVSVSQDNQGSIRATLRYISEKPAIVPANCKPEGRLSYISDGKIDVEADVYFSNGCQFFVFMEDGKPRYANYMTPDGINFFTQVTQAKPQ